MACYGSPGRNPPLAVHITELLREGLRGTHMGNDGGRIAERDEGGAEYQVEIDHLGTRLGRLWQMLHGLQRLLVAHDRFSVRRASCRLPACLPQVQHGPPRVPPAHKMLGEFCGHLSCVWAITHFEPRPDHPVPSHSPTHRHPVVDHLTLQVVEEPVAGVHRRRTQQI
jgi:hypothetical protein